MLVAIGIGHFADDVGRDLIISGSSQVPVILVNSKTTFLNNILQMLLGGFLLDLGRKVFHILDSITSIA